MADSPSPDASSPDPAKVPLEADLPEPYGGGPLPPPLEGDGEKPRSEWTEAEKEAFELDDDDLDLVAGGLPTPLPADERAAGIFRRGPSGSGGP